MKSWRAGDSSRWTSWQGPVSGNPLAVVVDSHGLKTEEMEAIARWMNLSETAFLLPPSSPEADYRVRIFTLSGELPFAGHPTLGSCHVWLSSGGSTQQADAVLQECGIGLIPIRRGERFAFSAPPLLRSGPVEAEYLHGVARALGVEDDKIVDRRWVDEGAGWVGAPKRRRPCDLSPARPLTLRDPDRSGRRWVGFYPDASESVCECVPSSPPTQVG